MRDPLIGTTLAGYRVDRRLGRGGMGVVYAAEEVGLSRWVALKVIAPEFTDDPKFRERFVTEARVAAALDHPHVLPVFRAGEDDGLLFLAMRMISGEDLGTVVRHCGPLPLERALHIGAQIGSALEAAHERGLVHRDVKPANVLVAAGDHAYLADFGLVKELATTSQTATGVVLGTPDFVAPEQIRGDPVGPWTDIYALGCVLHFALTGRVLFALGVPEAKLWAHLSERPPSVSATRDDIPAAVDDVLRVALAKSPQERFQTVSELLAAARDAAAESPAARRAERVAHPEAGSASEGFEDAVTRAAAGRRELRAARDELVEKIVASRATTARLPAAHAGSIACPFKGLSAFEFDDDAYFFGRERLTAELVARLVGGPLLGIVGASGGGKSSVLRAGVLPALAAGVLPGSESWPRALIRPGPRPTGQLEQAAKQLADAPRAVLAIDQFEEVFTTCRDEEERRAFIARLLQMADGERCLVVVVVRADFYERCAAYPELSRALAANHVVVGPMDPQELRGAIEGPAQRADLLIEPGLVDALLADLRHVPGTLPLLSTALVELWQQRDGRCMRLATYERGGGVGGAVARLAERALEPLTADERAVARRTILQMVEGENDAALTGRRLPLGELGNPRTDDAARVVAALAERRLLTIGDGAVELAHEALLREWPRLRGWIDEDAENRRQHQRLANAAGEWEAGGRDDGDLYRGARLESGLDWRTGREAELAPIERAFLDTSAAAQQSELHVARRRARRLRSLAGVLVVLVLLAGASAVLAIRQSQRAESERQSAVSRGLATQGLALRDENVDQAALLSLEAYRAKPTIEARNAVLSVLPALERGDGALPAGRSHGVAFSPDGKTLATAGADGTLRLWDVATRRPLGRPLAGHDRPVFSVAFSPDGRTLASTAEDGFIALWDLATRRVLRLMRTGQDRYNSTLAFNADGTLLASGGTANTVHLWSPATGRLVARLDGGHSSYVTSVSFSPDGATLASSSADRTVRLWNVATRRPVGRPLSGHRDDVLSVAFSADGDTLASAGDDTTIRLWNVSTRRALGPPLRGHTAKVWSVAFGARGGMLASAGEDQTIRLWNPTTQKPVGEPLAAHTDSVDSVAFSPDASKLASASPDGTVRLWTFARRPLEQALTGHTGPVTALAFAPGSRTLASASRDRTIRLWNATTREPLGAALRGHSRPVSAVAFSPDGTTLVSSSGDDYTLRLWSVSGGGARAQPSLANAGPADALAFGRDGTLTTVRGANGSLRRWELVARRPLGAPFRVGQLSAVAFTADGHEVATAGEADGTVRRWEPTTRLPVGQPLKGHTATVRAVAFNAGRTVLASGSDDATVRLWDLKTGRQIGQPLTGHTGPIHALAFSPDGNTLASAGRDSTMRLWDVRSRRLLGQPFSGHAGAITALAFSPDGSTLASASTDRTVRLWQSILWSDDWDAFRQHICTRVRRNLSASEQADLLAGAPYEPSCG